MYTKIKIINIIKTSRYQKTSSRTAEFTQLCHGIEGQITFVWRHLLIDIGLSYLNKSNPFQTLARKLTIRLLNDEKEKIMYLGDMSKESFSNVELGAILVIEKNVNVSSSSGIFNRG